MKHILLILFLSTSLFGYSQNWNPLNPKWSPQYATSDSDSIDFCTKIDSVVSSADQTIYYLHPTYKDCTDCPPSDEHPLGIYLKESPLLGEQIIQEGDTFSFQDLGLVLKPGLNSGDSYSFSLDGGNEITATITVSDQTNVLSDIDSTKTFSFSNGMEIILSKNYGIISITNGNENTEVLIGIPELEMGTYFPGIRDFYDFEVGDVFMYLTSEWVDDPYGHNTLSRVEITDLNYTSDTLTITFNRAIRGTTHGSYGGTPWDNTGSSFTDNETQKISMHNCSLKGLIPGMLTFPIDSTQAIGNIYSTDGMNYFSDQFGAAYYVDSSMYNGRSAVSIGGVQAAFGDSSAIEPNGSVSCDPCNIIWNGNEDWKNAVPINTDINDYNFDYNFTLNDSLEKINFFDGADCTGYSAYADGLGLIVHIANCGLSFSQLFMIGYRKGEEEYGTIYPLEAILNDVTELSKIDVKIFPNPSNDFFELDIPESHARPFRVSLTDLSGRVVFSESGVKGKNRITTENLASGIYILHGANDHYIFSQKVVVE